MDSSISHSRTRVWLALILLLALAIRCGAAWGLTWLLETHWHRQFLISGDAEGYWELGCKLAHGETFAVHNPPRMVHRMPGFPAILAISVQLFGEDLLAARMVLAVVGTVAVWLVFLVGRKYGGDVIGLLAAALAAVSPTLIAFSVIELSETAFAAALLVNILAAQRLFEEIRAEGSRNSRVLFWSLITGASVALGVSMRPSWLLAAPIEGFLLVMICPLGLPKAERGTRRFRALVATVSVCAGMVLTLLPWGIRNQRVSGHFTLTTFWMGPSLYDGLNPRATGDSDMRFFDEDRLSDQLSEFEIDREYRRRAWEFAAQNPGRTTELAVIKAGRYWSVWPNAGQFQNRWLRLVVGSFALPMFLLAAWGVVAWGKWGNFWSRGQILRSESPAGIVVPDWPHRLWSIAVLAGPIVYFALIHMVFVSSLRYRLPAEYPLLVASAWGLRSLWGSKQG